MKKTLILLVITAMFANTQAQEDQKAEYKVPNSFQFHYKVVYQITNDEKGSSQTITYYFSKYGNYMGIQPSGEGKERSEFIVNTSDGKMIIFSDGHNTHNQKQPQKLITVMDMRGMMKGLGDATKSMSQHEKKPEGKKEGSMDNFKKTGKTMQISGYTAEEYEKTFTAEDKESKGQSGTMYIWYAKVDFDPSMMFTMGMGRMGAPNTQSSMNQAHPNNFFGMGLTEKNYLLVEVDYAQNSGKSGTGMKVVSIEKITFNKETAGYSVQNFGGMGGR